MVYDAGGVPYTQIEVVPCPVARVGTQPDLARILLALVLSARGGVSADLTRLVLGRRFFLLFLGVSKKKYSRSRIKKKGEPRRR